MRLVYLPVVAGKADIHHTKKKVLEKVGAQTFKGEFERGCYKSKLA